MGDKYRIDPDFVVPDLTAADMFGFCKLGEYSEAEHRRQFDWMREAGAKQGRVTIVSEEYPNQPYPHGYYFEGWKDEKARLLPFGEAEAPDKGCSPPLVRAMASKEHGG